MPMFALGSMLGWPREGDLIGPREHASTAVAPGSPFSLSESGRIRRLIAMKNADAALSVRWRSTAPR